MKRALVLGTVCAAALMLSGCNTVFGNTDNMKAFLSDLQTCERHYNVAVGTGGSGLSGPSFNGSATIDCKPASATVIAPIPAPPPQPPA